MGCSICTFPRTDWLMAEQWPCPTSTQVYSLGVAIVPNVSSKSWAEASWCGSLNADARLRDIKEEAGSMAIWAGVPCDGYSPAV